MFLYHGSILCTFLCRGREFILATFCAVTTFWALFMLRQRIHFVFFHLLFSFLFCVLHTTMKEPFILHNIIMNIEIEVSNILHMVHEFHAYIYKIISFYGPYCLILNSTWYSPFWFRTSASPGWNGRNGLC